MRNQRPRGSLTRVAVVDAALAVLDRVGGKALTIRSVAELAGAAPMSLYVHFANKQELLDLMAAEVTRRLYADAGHATWEAEFVSLCHQVHGILLEHPHWAALLARPIPATVLPLRERLLTLMVEGGIPLREAFTAVSNAGLVSLGAGARRDFLARPPRQLQLCHALRTAENLQRNAYLCRPKSDDTRGTVDHRRAASSSATILAPRFAPSSKASKPNEEREIA